MEKNKNYTVACTCANCGNHQDVSIDTGKRIQDALAHVTCNKCGCVALTQSWGDKLGEFANRTWKNLLTIPKKIKI